MIVNQRQDGWNIIFHRTHGLVAMKLALELKDTFWPLPDYRTEGLLAIAEHDDGRQGWDEKSYFNKDGTPLDYRDAETIDIVQARQVVEDARYTSLFMALMVSLHVHNLYKDERSSEAKEFICEQSQFRENLYHILKLKHEDILTCYDVLRWCDAVSLALCQNDLTNGGEGKAFKLGDLKIVMKRKEHTISCKPWPFNDIDFRLSFESYDIAWQEFNNNQELKRAIENTEPTVKTLKFSKGWKH